MAESRGYTVGSGRTKTLGCRYSWDHPRFALILNRIAHHRSRDGWKTVKTNMFRNACWDDPRRGAFKRIFKGYNDRMQHVMISSPSHFVIDDDCWSVAIVCDVVDKCVVTKLLHPTGDKGYRGQQFARRCLWSVQVGLTNLMRSAIWRLRRLSYFNHPIIIRF